MDLSAVIKENLTCTICQDIYTDPRSLPCQHAFCYECLNKHIIVTVKEKRSFKCPLCRKSTRPKNPNKRKETWANQFKHDFKLTNILEGLQPYVPEATSGSGAVAGTSTAAASSAAASVASPSDMPTSKMPRPKMPPLPQLRQEPRQVPIGTIQNNAHTESNEQSQHHDIQSSSILHTDDASDLQEASCDNSSRAILGSVETCIPLAAGDQVSYDLTVLVQGKKRIILTPHFEAKKLLAITLNPKMEEVSRCPLDLDATPSRICKIDNNVVAITTSYPNTIALYRMEGELLFQNRIKTKKSYDGIACLEDGLFVVTNLTDVDFIDYDGKVLAEHKITMPNVLRPDNCYVSVTPGGEIITTDISGNTLSCIKRNGKLFWQKKKKRKSYENPMGTAVDSSGAIFLAEQNFEIILQLDKMGSVVGNVVEKSERFRKPSAIALDNTGYMFVICDYNFVAVVKLSDHNS
ncbi:uncharacterized protein LOC124111662 [Haliotis rufescens]|uniref:uncharacterized protein LOC124111662 n=1 Tax=Haliotis rufescens TaxID=6454 RepID=UPI00201EB61B|nr:uncharacterized protein LOC124111662 [Haliotis rufescens]